VAKQRRRLANKRKEVIMHTNRFLTISIVFIILMFLASIARADYALEASTFTTAGGQGDSITYGLFSSFGQQQPIEVPVGDATSPSFQLFAGFLSVAMVISVPPTIENINPDSACQGMDNLNVIITGTNFQSDATVEFSGTGITINSTTVDSDTQITLDISVASTADTSSRHVTVTNPDDESYTLENGFTVNATPTITNIDPNQVAQGETVDMVITGTGFQDGFDTQATQPKGLTVSFCDGITKNSTTVDSSTQITVNITVSETATLGPCQVTVTNPSDCEGIGEFTIIEPSGEPISGTITDGTVPIAATVEAWQNGILVKSTDTPDGYYVLHLPSGVYVIRAYSVGYYATVLSEEITPPATDVNLSLTRAPTVTTTNKVCDFWCQDNTKMDWQTHHIPVLVQLGDVITARDPDGIICGITTVGEFGTDEGDYFIHVYGDDATTPGVDEGAIEGDTITFFINGNPASVISGTPQWHSGGSFEVCLSATTTRLGDVSGNGQITAYDAALILQHVVSLRKLSDIEQERADVTGDETISALDAALILQYTVGLITNFPGDSAPVAPALNPKNEIKLLTEAIEKLDTTHLDKEQKKVLEQLKHVVSQKLLPTHTTFLQNFPNPFNPETWIPYQLSKEADVNISIYNIKGQLIRKISLGHKQAGYYLDKSKAAYWDGKNNAGEKVASGTYFYQIWAGDFKAMRKMFILK